MQENMQNQEVNNINNSSSSLVQGQATSLRSKGFTMRGLPWVKIIIGIMVFAVIIFVAYFFVLRLNVLNLNYGDVYRLVPEKVSQSAVIRISLPRGVDKELAKNNITFEPKIEGKWLDDKKTSWFGSKEVLAEVVGEKVNTNFIFFKPDSTLALNRHYSVAVNLGEGKVLTSDFLSVDNPQVISVFPKDDSEASEDSKITIVFNRPMVPVTTLEQLEKQNIPIEITPKTEGKFKWISTNTLQFIAKDGLRGSTNYKVKIKSGFVSIDGLNVSDFESSFQTRNLRYLDGGNYSVIENQIYDKPVRIYFNQAVDLSKTKGEIKLTDKKTNKEVSFIAEYAKPSKEEQLQKPQYKTGDGFGYKQNFFESMYAGILDIFKRTTTDASQDITAIDIYPKKDFFGRNKIWNFNNSYTITINKAYPQKGDIILNQVKNIDFTTTDITAPLSFISNRTNYSGKDLFDPEGVVEITFFEPINLGRSRIEADKMKDIEYGEKCRSGQYYNMNSCEKVEDRTKVRITFNSNLINPGETINLRLKEIINDSGIKINKDEMTQAFTVYKDLQIRLGDLSASYNKDTHYLKGFYICSNNPLAIPEKKDLKNAVKTDVDYQINYFSSSYLEYNKINNLQCRPDEFSTWVSGGFMPNTDYKLKLDINDVFGQNAKNDVSFSTGEMSTDYVSIFMLQQAYSIATPDKTVLTFGSMNIDYVNIQICKTSALKLKQLYSKYDFDDYACDDIISKKIALPKRYWINNYFDVDISDYFQEAVGNYIISLTHPLYKDYQGNLRDSLTYVTVTNLAVAEKSITPAIDYLGTDQEFLTAEQIQGLKNIYWVTDIKTQNPVEGAVINFYSKAGNLLDSAETNSDGVAFLPPATGVDSITASFDQDSTIIMRNSDKFIWSESASNYKKAYIYTDKPLYRPEQTVHIKGILRIGYDGNYEMFNNSLVQVKLFNSKGNEILDKELGLDEFGTFNIDFNLDKDSALGTYRVCLQNSYFNCANFDVLEYVPASFQVNTKSDKQEYISKDTVNIKVNANYYFGAPVSNSQVEYTLSSQNYYFDKYKGDDWYSFGFWDDYYYEFRYYYGDSFISRGSGTTNSSGEFNVSQKLDLQEMFRNNQNFGSKIIVLDTTVRNNLGQSVSSQQSFIAHMGQYYIGIKTDPYFVGKNEEFNLKVKTVDVNGNNVSQNGITAEIFRVNWEYIKRQEVGGAFNYKWEKKTELSKSINLSTDNNGFWSQKVKLDKEGEYEILVSGTDKAGNQIKSKYNIYVFGPGYSSFMTTDDTNLGLKASKTNLKVGEEGQIIIESPFAKSKALICIERGRVFDYKIVDFVGNIQEYKFKVEEQYAPNIFVSVLLQSQDPAIKFGTQEFKIESDKSKINFDIKTDKKFYSPGENVKMNITATDNNGKPIVAQTSVAVVDLSVLALKGNPKKDPLVFFYDGFPLTVSTASNIKNAIVKIEPVDRTKGGGAGLDADDSTNARGDFRDTAFWQANIITDENGRAEIFFKLPDNLTTWQAEVLGVTKDTKLGVNYAEFMSKKELMAVPLKPRFIIPGDVFYVGAQIFNQSENNKNIRVSFKSDTLQFLEKNKEKSISIGKNQSQSVFFEVKAPQNIGKGSHVFTISVDDGSLNDSVVQTIPIRSNSTYEVVATAGYTQGDLAREVIYIPSNVVLDKGELTLRSSATLAVYLSDSLNYLIAYPYGCSEQISSRLKAIAVIKSGMQIPNLSDKLKLDEIQYEGKDYTIDQLVEVGLSKLYSNQNSDGGFSLWGDGYSNYYTTLSVVDSLNYLSKARYQVSKNSINKAVDYLFNYYNQYRSELSDDDIISLALILMQTDNYYQNSNLINEISSIIKNNSLLQDKLSSKSLAQLGIIVNRKTWFAPDVVTKINKILDNKINIDSRGAFLQADRNNWYYNFYESTIADTALYLDSLAVGKRDTAITDKVLRWLLNSRGKDGAWGSTQNTLAVVNALVDYLSWKKETDAVYTLDTNLNSKTIDTYSVSALNILDQNKKSVPITDFKIDDYNFLELSKKGKGSLYYDMDLKYYLSGIVEPRDEGFAITRQFYALEDKSGSKPLSEAKQGQLIREHLTIVVPVNRKHVQIEDYIPAGMEIVDMSLATEDKSLRFNEIQVKAPEIYPDFKEIRDDRAYIYTNELNSGVYEFDYYLRALVPGNYLQLPAIVSEMYTPENFGRTASSYFKVVK